MSAISEAASEILKVHFRSSSSGLSTLKIVVERLVAKVIHMVRHTVDPARQISKSSTDQHVERLLKVKLLRS